MQPSRATALVALCAGLLFVAMASSGAVAAATPAVAALKVGPLGHLVDARGRVVTLRGVNVAKKVPNFELIKNGKDAASYERFIAPLVEWGFNSVRLAFTWEAFAPAPGVYNDSYLQAYRRLVQELASRGIYTVVDFHQDVFSRWILGGCGEGFPQWTVPVSRQSAPADQTSADALYKKACPWWGVRATFLATNATLQEQAAVYSQLYTINHPVRNAFLDMIKRVAQGLADIPHVIAYDIINEPKVVADTAAELVPLYRDAATAIRSVHPSVAIMYEQGHGVANNILPNPNIPNSIYSSHFYDRRGALDLVIDQVEYWLKPTFWADLTLQISLQSKFLPLLKSKFDANIAKVDEAIEGFKQMAGLLFNAAVSVLPKATSDAIATQFNQALSEIGSLKDLLSKLDSRNVIPDSLILSILASIEVVKGVANTVIFGVLAPTLRLILPLLPTSAEKDIAASYSTGISYGSAYILGEFGVPPRATFIDPLKYMDDVYNSVEKVFGSLMQWGYTPEWDPVLKDGWNLEDFSIVDNELRPRRNFFPYRPYPIATAGIPISLSVAYSKKTLVYSYTANPNIRSSGDKKDNDTVFFFHTTGLCGDKSKGKIETSDSTAVNCEFDDLRTKVHCDSLASKNVTVTLSC